MVARLKIISCFLTVEPALAQVLSIFLKTVLGAVLRVGMYIFWQYQRKI